MTLHIAYIDHTGEMGGAEHLLLQLMTGLPRDLVDPFLICGADGAFPRKAQASGVATIVMPLPRLTSLSFVLGQKKIINPFAVFLNVVSLLKAAWQLRGILREMNADIVQTNTAFAHVYGGLAARLVGIPAIWYFHDLVEPHRLHGLIARVWRLLARLFANRVVGVSHAVLNMLAMDPERSSVIYAGLPDRGGALSSSTNGNLRMLLSLPPTSLVIGYVGRIGYVKALDVLARSAQHVLEEQPNTHFVLVGDAFFGEIDYKIKLGRLVEKLGLTAHWHLLGYLDDVQGAIEAMDLLVLPSRREAFGLVLLEAAFAEKAVVATRVGGIPEIVIDEETGELVPAEDDAALANAILHLLAEPELRMKMGRNAKEHVRHQFEAQRYFAQFTKLYLDLNQHS